jgi:hypothetical protein
LFLFKSELELEPAIELRSKSRANAELGGEDRSIKKLAAELSMASEA